MGASRKTKAVVSVALVALWGAFIFYMSSRTGDASQGMSDGFIARLASMFNPGYEVMDSAEQGAYVESFSFPVRKAAHLSEYALLGAFALNAFVQVGAVFDKKPSAGLLVLALAFSIAFACSDEFHQLFVDGRSGQLTDVLIDSGGALLGVLLLTAANKNWGRFSITAD